MKKFVLLLLTFYSFTLFSQELKKPNVYTEKYKTIVTEGKYINCLTVNDLGAVFYLNAEMQTYDQLHIELHRFGEATNIIASTMILEPSSKEFQKKYAKQDSIKVAILAEETSFGGSDLTTNTGIFPANSTTNMAFCKSHDLKNCSWYIILRGYKKTGEKTQFNEDVFDKGTDLSQKSVVFKSWQDKTVR